MAGVSETISFKAGELFEPLEAMLRKKGLSRTDFFKQLTAAAIVLHERGEDPILALTKMPQGGFATIETERALTSQLVVASHRALTEMQAAIGSLWPVMVGVGAMVDDTNTISGDLEQPSITLVQAYKLCDNLTSVVEKFTQAWIAADSTLDQTRA
jgi:hypothetical protein